jgi:ABC-type transporter MlaC component
MNRFVFPKSQTIVSTITCKWFIVRMLTQRVLGKYLRYKTTSDDIKADFQRDFEHIKMRKYDLHLVDYKYNLKYTICKK